MHVVARQTRSAAVTCPVTLLPRPRRPRRQLFVPAQARPAPLDPFTTQASRTLSLLPAVHLVRGFFKQINPPWTVENLRPVLQPRLLSRPLLPRPRFRPALHPVLVPLQPPALQPRIPRLLRLPHHPAQVSSCKPLPSASFVDASLAAICTICSGCTMPMLAAAATLTLVCCRYRSEQQWQERF